MKSIKIYKLNELKDSRLLFDKKPPVFGYILILVVGFLSIATIVWSLETSKVYTIQAQGIVTNEDANYVMCSYTGEIIDCNLKEGMLVQKGDILFKVKSTDYNIQQEQLEQNKETYEKKIKKYKKLVKSIKDDKNYFDASNPKDELYYSTFENYKSQIKQNTVDASAYSAYGYTEEQIESELEKNQGRLSQIYYEAIQSAENAISEARQQIESINAQLLAISAGRQEYSIRATASGVLHMVANYKDGMVVQTTQTVATISPQNSGSIIEAYVSTADMARLHEGDRTQIVVDGLAQNVYGTISGKVKSIDSNVTSQQSSDGTTSQVFKVIIDMDTDYVISQSGDKVDIRNGMTATSRISYDKVTYFNYVLEKLGLKIRK